MSSRGSDPLTPARNRAVGDSNFEITDHMRNSLAAYDVHRRESSRNRGENSAQPIRLCRSSVSRSRRALQ